ncbi:MAG: protein-glutamate O-methyltransferase CheR [Candidatus Zixiibacteriota bacterium]|nr:MAG: protein-glutamate O-methyltransferase CheR [candidate division Zixibacteria bacterium]
MLENKTQDLDMNRDDFLMIRDYIHEKSGIFFAENKMYLVKNRLSKRVSELSIKTYKDYLYHVKYDTSMKEFHHLMDLMTTNETSFFRNEPQLQSFSKEVLPLIIDKKQKEGGAKTIKIWSAGCSTGEEPYTLAMIVQEKLATLPGWKSEIVANDISEEVLQKARKGEYSGITLRNIVPTYLTKYFTKSGDKYIVKPEIKAMVKFSFINLNQPRMISLNSNCDVIFCRNVMIYFSDEVKKQIVRGYYNSLRPGGYFYIGHSETLHGISKSFKLVYFKNALVYQKEDSGTSKSRPALSATLAGARKHVTQRASSQGATTGASKAIDLLSKIKPMTVKK